MTTHTEEDFQKKANEYAAVAIQSLREMLEALDHAGKCNGECEECAGTGVVDTDTEHGVEGPCPICKGAKDCQEGKDSDEPDAWHDEDRARARIDEDPLSIEVRGDWHTPGSEEGGEPTDYAILLCTGGPAARIVGELTSHKEPKNARFEYQDWFKPWTEAYTNSADDAVILQYAQQFYYGG